MHYFVIEDPAGKFHAKRSEKRGVVHGRFTDLASAQTHAAQLRRNHLSPALDKSGKPLTPAQRARLGVWHPTLYEQALARGRAHLAVLA